MPYWIRGWSRPESTDRSSVPALHTDARESRLRRKEVSRYWPFVDRIAILLSDHHLCREAVFVRPISGGAHLLQLSLERRGSRAIFRRAGLQSLESGATRYVRPADASRITDGRRATWRAPECRARPNPRWSP